MAYEVEVISLGFVNCYLVKTGGDFILVDTGFPPQRGALEKKLEEAGCGPGRLKLIVITHGDIDHTGNAAYLRDKYKTRIAMHADDSPMVEKGEMLAKRKVRSFFMRLMHLFMARSKKFKKMLADFERFKPDIYLNDGQSLMEYGLDATVVHLPGHTPGSIGLLARNRDFFVGDTLNNSRRPTWAVIVENEHRLADTLGKIKTLGAETVYPGHGKPFKMKKLQGAGKF